jgi:3-oxoacyl-(acyl-carrier-protein) synthase
MSRRIFVTGIGIVSAIGNNIEDTIISIINSKTGISKISNLPTRYNQIPAAEVKLTDKEIISILNIEEKTHLYSRTALLGIMAAKEAMNHFSIPRMEKVRTGLISATTVGGMNFSEHYYKDLLINDTYREFIETFDCADAAERIADYLNIKHYVATVSTACSSSANSIMIGARLILHNRIDRAFVGGTDALTKFTINGFNSLEILDPEPCKPFDAFRKGLTIGEGAAFLVLEPEDLALKENLLCEIKGYANANDAFHPTASSPDGQGAYLAMKQTLEMAGLEPSAVDYINAHGTGTDINDLSEGKAIERLFLPDIPPVSSTKAFTGHTLGAAGAIEAVLSVLAIKKNMIYPNLHFSTPMKDLSFSPVTKLITEAEVKNVLSNSFGFGGNNSSLLFTKQ